MSVIIITRLSLFHKIIDKYKDNRDDVMFHNNLKYYSYCKLYGYFPNSIANIVPRASHDKQEKRNKSHTKLIPMNTSRDVSKNTKSYSKSTNLIKNPFQKEPIKHKKTCKFHEKYNKNDDYTKFEFLKKNKKNQIYNGSSR